MRSDNSALKDRLQAFDDSTSSFKSRLHFLLCAFLLLLATALLAWFTTFSVLASYDDEAYVMMTLQTFGQGHRLYSDTFTQYGPAFYICGDFFHKVFDWPLTHDAVRLKTVLIWLAAVFLVLQIAWQCSRRLELSVAIAILASLQMSKLSLEPGHPQELILLLTLCLISLNVTIKSLTPVAILSGLLIALISLIKINCGIVVGGAMIASMSINAISKDLALTKRRIIQVVTSLPIVFLAVAMIRGSTAELTAMLWPIQGLVAFFTVVTLCSKRQETDNCDDLATRKARNTLLLFLGAGTFVTALVIGRVLSQGNTISEVLYGVVFQHQRLTDDFFQPIAPSILIVVLMIIGTVLAYLNRGVNANSNPAKIEALTRHTILYFSAVILVIATDVLCRIGSPLSHGLQKLTSSHALSCCGPWCIALAMRYRSVAGFRCDGPITLLALIGIASPWIAYPVAGSQLELGTIPTLLAITILATPLAESSLIPQLRMPKLGARKAFVFVFASTAMVTAIAFPAYRYFVLNSPLELAGATWLRLPADQCMLERSTVQSILRMANSNRPCSNTMLLAGHASNRYYFWTGLKPLTSINPTFPHQLITPLDEERILDAIQNGTSLIVVRSSEYNRLRSDRTPKLCRWIDATTTTSQRDSSDIDSVRLDDDMAPQVDFVDLSKSID